MEIFKLATQATGVVQFLFDFINLLIFPFNVAALVGVRTTGTDKNIKIYNNISNSEFANIVHILVRPETNDS